MTASEKNKLKSLIEKYNPVLLESIGNALTEDLYNLIIVNRDDQQFELKDLLLNKEELKRFVMKEFMTLNNQPITTELKNMEEIKISLGKEVQLD